MRTQPVEKRTDARTSFAPEADRQRWRARREAAWEAVLDAGAASLAEALVAADARDCDAAIETALDLLGRAFEARRVVFYGYGVDAEAADRHGVPPRLVAERCWTPTAGPVAAADEPPVPVAAIRDTPGGLGLRTSDPAAAAERSPSTWRVARSGHVVEVPGAAGPLGAFVIEGGLSATRWSARLLDRAALVGRLLGGALERLRLAREVEDVRGRLAQNSRLECLGRVAASVAHDFNNVLTAIQGYTDLLEMELGDRPVGTEELGEIRQASVRAADLVQQVLDFGRHREPKTERLDLIATLRSFEGLIARILGRGIELEIVGEDRLPAVRIDVGRFEPVVMNLASNARDAIGQRGGQGRFTLRAVTVEIDEAGRERETGAPVAELEPGRYVRLTARDDGCGIDPGIRDRVFEAYFTTKSEGCGTGLGLASLLRFQRASGGAVRLESDPGRGTALHLYFPAASDADD